MSNLAEIVQEYLNYDPETGTLNWKERARHRFIKDKDWHWWNKRFSGKEAGSITTLPNGYKRASLRITITGGKTQTVFCHRAAWMIMTGVEPAEVDHINGDALDNRWSNLREVNRKENCRNRAISTRNSSGVVGVNWSKQCGKWRAEYYENGKNVYLGLFSKIEDAEIAVQRGRESSGYKARHGEEAPYLKDGYK